MPTRSGNTYLLGESNKIFPAMDVPTFDGRLNYSGYLRNPQIFLDCLQNMDMYFDRYPFSEAEKVRFAITKLTEQASQY